jgi:hypothetical protein
MLPKELRVYLDSGRSALLLLLNAFFSFPSFRAGKNASK